MESIEESKAAEQSCGSSDESKAKAVATSETIEAFGEKKDDSSQSLPPRVDGPFHRILVESNPRVCLYALFPHGHYPHARATSEPAFT
jgi:hypothetical protein